MWDNIFLNNGGLKSLTQKQKRSLIILIMTMLYIVFILFQYANKPKAKEDVINALRAFKDLHPKEDTYGMGYLMVFYKFGKYTPEMYLSSYS